MSKIRKPYQKPQKKELANLSPWFFWEQPTQEAVRQISPTSTRQSTCAVPTKGSPQCDNTSLSPTNDATLSEEIESPVGKKRSIKNTGPKQAAVSKRTKHNILVPASDFSWEGNTFIRAISPTHFFAVDPFCEPAIGTYLALNYFSDRQASYHVCLTDGQDVYLNLHIEGSFVDYFRERHQHMGPNSWDHLSASEARCVMRSICAVYDVAVPELLEIPAEHLAHSTRMSLEQRYGFELPSGTIPYNIYLETYYYDLGPKHAALKFQKGEPPNLNECCPPKLPPYELHKLAPHTIYYRPGSCSITFVPGMHVRCLLRALYYHFSCTGVFGFHSCTGQRRSRMWADAYWGIVHRIIRSEETDAGKNDWTTIAQIIDAEFADE